MNLGYIERSRLDGTPTVGDANRFTYSFNGAGGTLVYANTAGSGSYRAQYENTYVEFKYTAGSNSWQAFDGQGGVYTFGLAPLANPAAGPWVLTRAVDASGNTVTYTYLPGVTHADGSVEPPCIGRINYTGDASTGELGANVVQFDWENRYPDGPSGTDQRLTWVHGQAERRTQRLKTISVWVGLRAVRRYELHYQQSPQTGESLLHEVVLRSGDSSLSYTLRSLTYASFTRGWQVPDQEGAGLSPQATLLAKDTTTGTYTDSGERVLDVNGDGYPDLIRLDSTSDFTITFALGGGNTSFDSSSDEAWAWNSSMLDVVHGSGDTAGTWFMTHDGDGHRVDGGLRLVDLNADGLPDFVIIRPGRNEVWLNTGTGWALDDTFSAALATLQAQVRFVVPDWTLQFADGSGNPTGLQLVDLNGDGRPDLVWDFQRACLGLTERQLLVRLNTGHTFVPAPDLETALKALPALAYGNLNVFLSNGHCPGGTGYGSAGTTGVDFLDVNGDGLADFVRTQDGNQSVALNTGHSSFVASTSFTASLQAARLADGSAALASTNGDGTQSFGLMPVDLNGDGLPDYVRMVCSFVGNFCTGSAVAEAWLNTGSGWVRDDALSAQVAVMSNWQSGSFVNSQGGQGGAVFADLDADGLMDLVVAPGGAQGASVYFSGGGRAPRANPRRKPSQPLIHVVTALGEVVDLEYGTSAWVGGASSVGFAGGGPYHLAQALPVCVSLTRSDGRQAITYVYDYAQGRFADNQFYGFGLAKATVLAPNGWSPSGLVRQLRYFQEDGLVGQVQSDSLANGLSEHTEAWARVVDTTSATPITQLQLVATDEYLRDVGAPVRHKRVTQTYDRYLNRVTVLRESDVGLDPAVTTTFTYASQAPFGFTSAIAQVAVDGPDAHSLTRLRYDDQPYGAAPVRGLVTDVFDATQVSPVQSSSTFVHKHVAFDHFGNSTAVTDAEGHTTTFAYDSTHTFVTQAVDPAGNSVTSTIDLALGTMLTHTDASGAVTRQTFDALGRLSSQQLPGDAASAPTVTFTYSPPPATPQLGALWVEVTRHAPGTALTTRSTLDGWGQAYQVASGEAVVQLDYDDLGNLLRQSSPALTYARDELRRPLSVTGPDGRAQRFSYQGRTTLTTNPAGQRTRYLRDGNDNLIEVGVQAPGGEQVTRYQLDAFGRLRQSADAQGAVTRITYDDLGRRQAIAEPSAGTSRFSYDSNGRLTGQVRDDGHVSSFSYGSDGAFLGKRYADGSSASFTFGAAGASDSSAGRVTRVVDPAGTLELRYDVRGRVIERRRTIGEGLPGAGTTYVTGYGYDSLDRLTALTTPDGFITLYAYDASGRLSAIVDREGHAVTQGYTYTALGQLTSMQFGNGVRAALSYDASMRLAGKVTTTADGAELQHLGYGYDLTGNVTSITDSVSGEALAYTYDGAGRLTHARGSWGEEGYEYDAAGNLTRKGSVGFALDPGNPQQVLCAVDLVSPPSMSALAADPKLAACRDLVARAGALSLAQGPVGQRAYAVTYDHRGDVVERGELQYEYDDEGHLTRVLRGDEVLERNVYDAAGQRVLRITAEGTEISIDGVYEDTLEAHQVRRHVFAGGTRVATLVSPRPLVLIDHANVSDANGGPQTPGTGGGGGGGGGCTASPSTSQGLWVLAAAGLLVLGWRRPRVRRPGVTAVVALLVSSMVLQPPRALAQAAPHDEPRRWYYYHPDHVGSTSLVTDERGQVVERHTYRPYGEGVDVPSTHGLPAGFDGQTFDAAAGLSYFGARHYDASLGRFLTPDTQVPDPKDPRALLRYAFAADNPIRYVDPSGHNWLSALITVLVTILIIVVAVAITLATGGFGGIVLGALAGAAIGAGGGAAVGLLEGKSGSDLYYSIAVGAVLGALTGAAAGFSVADVGLSGAALAAFNVGKEVVVSAAIGAVGEAIPDQVNGVDPRTMLVNCLISAGISVAFAGVGAGLGKALGAGLRALSGKLAGSAPEVSAGLAALTAGRAGEHLSKAFDVIEFSVGVASGVFGGPATNVDSYAQAAADASLNAHSPQDYVSFVPPIGYTDASRDPRAALNFAPVTP